MNSFNFTSPIGNIVIEADDAVIHKLFFIDEPIVSQDVLPSHVSLLCKHLDDYFRLGKPIPAYQKTDMPVDNFTLRVWEELKTIPLGGTSTYRQIANKIGVRNGARAVGNCIGRNLL